MPKINLVLLNSHDAELDRVDVEVKDKDDCAREVMAAVARESWVLSVGDHIAIEEPK